jgi:hypothetical protein
MRFHLAHGRVFSSNEADHTSIQISANVHRIHFQASRGDLRNLRGLLGFNLLLQVFDSSASYMTLSRGEGELNPLVSAAIDVLGVGWALVYWKIFVCGLLIILYSRRRFQVMLPLRA